MKKILFFNILAFIVNILYSQSYIMPTSGTSSITTCNGKLYDSGGPHANYTNSNDAILNIQPDILNSSVTLHIDQLAYEPCCDYLTVYPDALPVSYNIKDGAILNKTYLSEDANGKIALHFYSNGSLSCSGFEITIGCISYHDTADLSITSATIPVSAIITDTLKYQIYIYSDYFKAVTGNVSVKTYMNSQNNFASAFLVDSVNLDTIPRGGLPLDIVYTSPDTLRGETYYIFSVIDADNSVAERNELNNIYTKAINLIKPKIDLGFTDFSYNGDYLISGLSYCTYGISAIGNKTCNDWEIQAYISKDKNYSVNDIPIKVTTTPTHGFPAYQSVLSYSDSDNLKDSIYYLFIHIKPKCGITEDDTVNNWNTRQVIVNKSPIDLRVDRVQTNNMVLTGGYAYVNYNLSYSSLLPINTSKVSFYLSEDSIFSKNKDTLLLALNFNWFGSTYSDYTNIKFPENKQGNFYLLCIIDPDSLINDLNRKNNCIAVPIKLSPPYNDLELLSNNVTYFKNGNYLTTTIQYKNSGNEDIGYFQAGYFLSADTILDINDRLLTSVELYGQNPGYSNSYQTNIYFDNNTNPLNKYLIVRLDYTNVYDEINEQNNYFINKISDVPPPDNSFNFVYRLKKTITANSGTILDNGGLGNYFNNSRDTLVILPSRLHAKLSLGINNMQLENCCDHLDIYYGIISDSTSARYVQSITSTSQTYKSDDPSGAISLIFTSDGSGNYSGFELKFDTSAINSNIDIIQKQFTISKNKYAKGEYVNYYLSTDYKGLPSYSYLYYGFYLSQDSILDLQDRLISTDYYYLYTGQSNITINSGFYLPTDIDTSTYYIICKADYNNAFDESNENNNTFFNKIKIVKTSLDIEVRDINLGSGILFKGNTYNMQVHSVLTGITISYDYIVSHLYLSHDKIIDASDIILDTYPNYISSYNSDLFTNFGFTLNDTIKNGLYYLIPAINDGFTVEEVNTSNNTGCIPIAVLKEENDLKILPLSVPDTILNNRYYQQKVSVTNIGSTKASGYHLTMYLSKDTKKDNTDIPIGYDYTNNGIQISEQLDLNIYVDLTYISDTGHYFILSKIESYPSSASDIDTTNNISINPVYVRKPQFDFCLTASPDMPTNLTRGNYNYLNYRLYNLGPDNSNNAYATFTVYLSNNNKLDSGDKLLWSSIDYYSIESSQYGSLSPIIYLSNGFTSGKYFLIATIESTKDTKLENNVLVSEVNIVKYSYDLVLKNVLFSETIKTLFPNTTIEGTCTLKNDGTNDLSGFTVGLFYSSDTMNLHSGNMLWCTYCDGLKSDSIWNYNFSCVTPASIPSNTRYLVLKADINNNISDDYRQNNQLAFEVNNYLDINSIQDNGSFIYPNPVINNLMVSISEPIGQAFISIYSASGKLVYKDEVIKNLTKIDMSKFDKGCYILNITSPNGIKTCKIIKE